MQGTPNAFTYETEFGPRLWVATMQRVPECDSMDGPTIHAVLYCFVALDVERCGCLQDKLMFEYTRKLEMTN